MLATFGLIFFPVNLTPNGSLAKEIKNLLVRNKTINSTNSLTLLRHFTNPLCVLHHVYCFTLRNELDNVKYRAKSVIRYSLVSSKLEDKQYISI